MDNVKIPKLIHYCWIGKQEKPKEVLDYINNWKEKLPDYQIMEWNEKNFDIENCCSYVKEAYKQQKWAFVTDYMRLYVLYKYGGIYLDTDVKIVKKFDELLSLPSFLCFECSFAICTAVIGAAKNTEWIKEVLMLYEKRKFELSNGQFDLMPNSKYLFHFFENKYRDNFSNQKYICQEVSIFPSYYFSPINYSTGIMLDDDKSYAIHYYSGTWKSASKKRKDKMMAFVTRVIGEHRRELIVSFIKKILRKESC